MSQLSEILAPERGGMLKTKSQPAHLAPPLLHDTGFTFLGKQLIPSNKLFNTFTLCLSSHPPSLESLFRQLAIDERNPSSDFVKCPELFKGVSRTNLLGVSIRPRNCIFFVERLYCPWMTRRVQGFIIFFFSSNDLMVAIPPRGPSNMSKET